MPARNETMLPIVERPLFGVAGFVAAAGFVGVFSASPANATLFQTSYTFDVDYCSTGCLNGGTGGTVTLTQNGKNSVTVDVLLNSSVDLFHSTNAFDSFAFDLVGNPAISVSNLTSGFALVSTTAGSLHQDGSGHYEYAVDQTAGPPGFTGISHLAFDITANGLTTDSFHELSSGASQLSDSRHGARRDGSPRPPAAETRVTTVSPLRGAAFLRGNKLPAIRHSLRIHGRAGE